MKKIELSKTDLVSPDEMNWTHWVMDNKGSSLRKAVEDRLIDLVRYYIKFYMGKSAFAFLFSYKFPRQKEQFIKELLSKTREKLDKHQHGYSFIMDDPEFTAGPLEWLDAATDDFYEKARQAIQAGDYKETDIFRD